MRMRDFKALPHGVYRVHWKSGGSSIATIGTTCDERVNPSYEVIETPELDGAEIRKAMKRIWR